MKSHHNCSARGMFVSNDVHVPSFTEMWRKFYIYAFVQKIKNSENVSATVLSSSIGGFTVTSHAVSRGRLAPLVGKRFVAGGLRMYFGWIHALFSFILLTHKIMILFCISVGYLSHCVDVSF